MGVAEYMYSERAFSLLQLEKIQDSPGNEKEVLLTSFESAVSLNRYNLRVFGKALMKEEATHSLGKLILAICSECRSIFISDKHILYWYTVCCFTFFFFLVKEEFPSDIEIKGQFSYSSK